MCIIVCKGVGSELPTVKELERCFESNDDGAGYAYRVGDKVHIQKGFKKFKHLMNSLERHNFGIEDSVMIHFRLGTHGSNSKHNTHPFPITDKIRKLKAIDVVSDYAVSHNGMFNGLRSGFKHDLSDTMMFVKDILSKPIFVDHLSDELTRRIINTMLGYGKLAILRGDGSILTFGFGWIRANKALAYSNNDFRKKHSTTEEIEIAKAIIGSVNPPETDPEREREVLRYMHRNNFFSEYDRRAIMARSHFTPSGFN